MEKSKIKIGIIGTGRIAHRFVQDLKMVEEATLSCVYNPHRKSAESFVEDICTGDKNADRPIATSDLAQLFEVCDAVYIASPHATHYEYAKKALEAGKHVLCEKPMTLVLSEAEELFQIAKDRKLARQSKPRTVRDF